MADPTRRAEAKWLCCKRKSYTTQSRMKKRIAARRTKGLATASARRLKVELSIRDSCLRMLNPLAGVLLRAGVGVGEFADLCRLAYVRVAASQLATPKRKANVSRIAVTTGLTRQQVARLLKSGLPASKANLKQLHRANRVLAGWFLDQRFRMPAGMPRPLSIRGAGNSFYRLVRHYGGDVPPRAVLDELRRSDAVRTLRTGKIVPTRRSVEYGGQSQTALHDIAQKLRLLAETLRHNLDDPASMLFEGVAVSNPLRSEHFPIAVRQLSSNAKRFLNASNYYLGRESRQEPRRKRVARSKALGVGVFLFSKEE